MDKDKGGVMESGMTSIGPVTGPSLSPFRDFLVKLMVSAVCPSCGRGKIIGVREGVRTTDTRCRGCRKIYTVEVNYLHGVSK